MSEATIVLHDPDHRRRPPRFTHDCDDCLYQGRTIHEDIYVCPQGGVMPTLVARYGDDAPEYQSGYVILQSGSDLRPPREMLQRILDGEGRIALPDPTREIMVGEINKVAGRMQDDECNRIILTSRIASRLKELEAIGIPHESLDGRSIRWRIDAELER